MNWQKSTFSEDQANCLEVAGSAAGVQLRESDVPEAVITTARAHLRTFLRAIKAGDCDQLAHRR